MTRVQAAAVATYAAGDSMSATALQHHMEVPTLKRLLGEAGVVIRPKGPASSVWSDALDAQLATMIAEGLSGGQIGERLRMTPGAIYGRARRINVLFPHQVTKEAAPKRPVPPPAPLDPWRMQWGGHPLPACAHTLPPLPSEVRT